MGSTLLIWHGYLLGGTGSNIYSANIARAWRDAGHDVVLMCQEAHPERFEFVDAVEDVDGQHVVERRSYDRERREGLGCCTIVRADIGGLLPVYLLDRYERFDEVKRFVDCDDGELERYRQCYARALDGVLDRYDVAGALLNHVVMGPPVLRPVFDRHRVSYAVKVHGSELEYCIAEDARFVKPAHDGLVGASAILVGSDHIATRTRELLGDTSCGDRIRLVPPGVDLDLFQPLGPAHPRDVFASRVVDGVDAGHAQRPGRTPEADAAVSDALDAGAGGLIGRLAAIEHTYDERGVDHDAAARLKRAFDNASTPVVCFVGKLIRQKGVHLLIAAMPLVLRRAPHTQFVIVGFGKLRETFAAFVEALTRGDRSLVDAVVHGGFELDGAPEPMRHVEALLEEFDALGEIDDYLACARDLADRVTFVGLVDHGPLSALWPLCTASVVPSISAEAFGMVSAEAAACGCLPVVAHHSGLADVADRIAERYPPALRDLVSFDAASPTAIRDLADRIVAIVELDDEDHARLARAGRDAVAAEWSWDSIAREIADELLGAGGVDRGGSVVVSGKANAGIDRGLGNVDQDVGDHDE